MNKKAVFVTLADRKYLEYAKQVFAGAYFNAGWKGDYLLLAHNIPEKDLKWFRKKGILIYHCMPIISNTARGNYSNVGLSKMYIFKEYFKKWNTIIYYDADTIIRYSLDNLIGEDGFGAVASTKLLCHFISPEKIKRFAISKNSFSSGMFFLNNKIIEPGTFQQGIKLYNLYREELIHEGDDQAILNLLFYKKWKNISPVYNILSEKNSNKWQIPKSKLDGIAIHVLDEKPWQKESFYHKEWLKNYIKFDNIDFKKNPDVKRWSKIKIFIYSIYLRMLEDDVRNLYYRYLTRVEKAFPKIFRPIKKIKNHLKLFKKAK